MSPTDVTRSTRGLHGSSQVDPAGDSMAGDSMDRDSPDNGAAVTTASKRSRQRRAPASPPMRHVPAANDSAAHDSAANDSVSQTPWKDWVHDNAAWAVREWAHDIRGPLGSLRESVRMVQDGSLGPLNSDQADFLGGAMDQCQVLEYLVDELSRVPEDESGLSRSPRTWTSIDGILELARSLAQAFCSVRGIALQIDAAVPKGSRVFADPISIVRLITNLVANAARVSVEGQKVCLRVQPAARDQGTSFGDELVWQVIDRGQGFGVEDLDRMVRRGHSGGHSTGLGLSICRRLAAIMHSPLSIESKLGTGTTLSFRTPTESPLAVAAAFARWRLFLRGEVVRPHRTTQKDADQMPSLHPRRDNRTANDAPTDMLTQGARVDQPECPLPPRPLASALGEQVPIAPSNRPHASGATNSSLTSATVNDPAATDRQSTQPSSVHRSLGPETRRPNVEDRIQVGTIDVGVMVPARSTRMLDAILQRVTTDFEWTFETRPGQFIYALDCRKVDMPRRLQQLKVAIAARLPDVRTTWSESQEMKIEPSRWLHQLTEMVVRRSLAVGPSAEPIGHLDAVRPGTRPIEHSDVASARLDEEIRRLGKRLSQQAERIRTQARNLRAHG
ncbi:MAG: HAMP domain-containing sensor histidine kinase [Planctomycetota bacterium]